MTVVKMFVQQLITFIIQLLSMYKHLTARAACQWMLHIWNAVEGSFTVHITL